MSDAYEHSWQEEYDLLEWRWTQYLSESAPSWMEEEPWDDFKARFLGHVADHASDLSPKAEQLVMLVDAAEDKRAEFSVYGGHVEGLGGHI